MNLNVKEYIKEIYSRDSRKYKFDAKSKEEHKLWKENLKGKLAEITGLDKIEKNLYKVEELERVKFKNYERIKMAIETMKNVWMPFYVLIPNENNGIPAIALHGHGSDGKNMLVGIECEELKGSARFNYSYAIELMNKGYIVYVPDICGSGDRREANINDRKNINKTSCTDINNAAISLGFSLTGIVIFELKQLIDYIKDKHGDKELWCCGFSGGGLYTLWIAAMDERITGAIVGGYYHGIYDTIIENNLCGCNFVPNLWKNIDICDLGCMIAPRKLAVEVGDNDPLNGKRKLENFYPQVEETKKAYKIYDAEKFKYYVGEGNHQWYGVSLQIMNQK